MLIQTEPPIERRKMHDFGNPDETVAPPKSGYTYWRDHRGTR